MNMKIYAVHDIKAETYALPYYSPNDEVALRHFRTGVKDPESDLSRNPEDYSLHYLGTYNQETGLIDPDGGPKLIGLAAQFANA